LFKTHITNISVDEDFNLVIVYGAVHPSYRIIIQYEGCHAIEVDIESRASTYHSG